MRSENSEDAVTWNVFRSLRQIDPVAWFAELWRSCQKAKAPTSAGLGTYVWRSVPPPPSLLASGDEHHSEIDVVLECPSWVWFIEAKFTSDISERTTVRADRDQVIRNIDVGSFYAGARDFYFSLLVKSAAQSPRGAQAVARYRDLSLVRQILAGHRPDGLKNLRDVTLMTWGNLSAALSAAAAGTPLDAERGYAERALAWMRDKELVDAAS